MENKKLKFNDRIGYAILAAGKGTRMKDDSLPKPLRLLNQKPLISYILATLANLGIDKKQIWLVVHHQEDKLKKALGPKYQYVRQTILDGTAGALADALQLIPTHFQTIAVFQADDSMFYLAKTIREFEADFNRDQPVMSLITLKKSTNSLGSLIRNKDNQPMTIWPQARCLENGLTDKELITGAYLFQRPWLESAILKLKANDQGEYGLPYLVDVAYLEKRLVTTYELKDPNQWASVNTPEELIEAEKRLILPS